MNPSHKSKAMEKALDNIFMQERGRTRTDSIRKSICSWCGKEVKNFRDEESYHEYAISVFCKKCQDETFDN